MAPFIHPSPLCWKSFPNQAGTSTALRCPLKNFLPNKASRHSTGWIFVSFQKNSSSEKSHSKPGENIICMACFQRDSVLSEVKRLLSPGVSWVALLSSSEHVEAQSWAMEKRLHEWQQGRRQRLGQIPPYLTQNPLGLLGDLQPISWSLMICSYTESCNLQGPGFICWTGPFDLACRLTCRQREAACACVCRKQTTNILYDRRVNTCVKMSECGVTSV